MKRCTKCNILKPLSEFHKHKLGKFGLLSKCKICQRSLTKMHRLENPEYLKRWHKSKKDGKYYVYFLYKINYVGITDSIYQRMIKHKHDNNILDVNDYYIIGKFDDRKTAERFEKYKHSLGYIAGGINLLKKSLQ